MLYSKGTFHETYGYWYALMREVAALFEAGNFRGVCPIYKPGVRQTYPKLPPLQLVGYRIVLSWAPEHIVCVSDFKNGKGGNARVR